MNKCKKYIKLINECIDKNENPNKELYTHLKQCFECSNLFNKYIFFKKNSKSELNKKLHKMIPFKTELLIKSENINKKSHIPLIKILIPATAVFILFFLILFFNDSFNYKNKLIKENKDFVASLLDQSIINFDNNEIFDDLNENLTDTDFLEIMYFEE